MKKDKQQHNDNPLFKLGLTGSIATGKSTALQVFLDLGHAVFSADAAVHKLYEGAAVSKVKRLFPTAILDNKVDRAALAKILLSDPDKLKKLEAIIHPMVQKEFQQTLIEAQRQNHSLLIVDVPLLFESKNNYKLDAVAVTFCDETEQKRRAMAREGMTEKKLDAILARQMSQAKKRRRAEFEIDTNGTLEETRTQIVDIATKCLELRQIAIDTRSK